MSVFIAPQKVNAAEYFTTSALIDYKIDISGNAFVTDTIKIKNNSSKYYPEKYVLYLNQIDPVNLNVYENANRLDTVVEKGSITKVVIKFAEDTAGLNKEKTFLITYEDKNIAKKIGDIWEVKVPKIENENVFDDYTIKISVPKIFGKEAIINPDITEREITDNSVNYKFSKDNIENNGIQITFGNYQNFTYSLSYHLENKTDLEEIKTIPLPPDTSTQKVSIQSIDPIPEDVAIDDDGNFNAKFRLKPGKEIKITVKGSVKIFAGPIRYLPEPSEDLLEKNKKDSKYWNSDNPKIKTIADSLSGTEDIYKFVYEYLQYDNGRAEPNAERFGSLKALDNPKKSLCTEFTDLFIAITRAKGIPAREIQGFAYTDNKLIMPLSLVTDVLHSWAEFWDSDAKMWVPVDPTWASTNKGVNYYKNLDMKHFAFVIHGENSENPLPPGSYKLGETNQKDVYVVPGNDENDSVTDMKLSYEIASMINPLKKRLNLKITNSGNTAVYGETVNVFFDIKSRDVINIKGLPPFGSFTKPVTIDYGLFARNAPDKIRVFMRGKYIEINLVKSKVIFEHSLLIGALIFCIAVLIFFLTRKSPKFNVN